VTDRQTDRQTDRLLFREPIAGIYYHIIAIHTHTHTLTRTTAMSISSTVCATDAERETGYTPSSVWTRNAAGRSSHCVQMGALNAPVSALCFTNPPTYLFAGMPLTHSEHACDCWRTRMQHTRMLYCIVFPTSSPNLQLLCHVMPPDSHVSSCFVRSPAQELDRTCCSTLRLLSGMRRPPARVGQRV
jgi:hypothetical protein